MDSTPLQWESEAHYKHNHYVLTNGWKEFLDDNKVEAEDSLVLLYNHNAMFKVDIFDKNGSIKSPPTIPGNIFLN